ncbi:MAG: hypothetical protein IK139_08770 [Lachnospiraceae bacterium]|nr:hypothetical protein [Lachnospiraceae bacterium]
MKNKDKNIFSKNAIEDDALEQVSGGAQSKYNGPYAGYWYQATCQSCNSIYHFMDEDLEALQKEYNYKCPCGGALNIENGHLLPGFQ